MDLSAEETGDTQAAPRSFASGDVVLSCEPWICSFTYQYYKKLCAYCFKMSTDKLMMCSHCQLHYYCGTECQTAEWKKDHKSECKMLKEMNAKIRKLHPNVEKEYDNLFGFCAAEILMAKIVNKIKSGKKEQLGLDGELTAQEILELLPYDPCFENLYKRSDRFLHPIIWPTATLGSIPAGFYQLARKVSYNAFPIQDQLAKEDLFGAGLFPRALHRQMMPVCWDINVTMDLQGRTLVVHAAEDIVSYAGLKDLRQNELLANIFAASLPERHMWFKTGFSRPCTCKKCTKEYDAEINPLKCSTTGCTERIPSDHRALQPCSQCGAVNEQRLRQLQVLMKGNTVIESVDKRSMARGKLQHGLLLELNQANIVHMDAHFHYVLGIDVLRFLGTEKRYEEAWKFCPQLVASVRAIYPKYHLGRACVLRLAGVIPCMWYIQVRKDAIRSHWKDVLDAQILDWLWEAREICRKLIGLDSQYEGGLTRELQLIGKITLEVTPEHVDQFHADWLRLQEG